MPSKHYYTHSSGYCFSQANPNGVFTPSNNNPKNLRAHLDIALSGKTVAWHANGNDDDNCDPEEVEACNISDLPDVPLTLLPDPSPTDCISFFSQFYVILAITPYANTTMKTIEDHLNELKNNYITGLVVYAGPTPSTPVCDPVTNPFELVVIFDDKIAISWGQFKHMVIGPNTVLVREAKPMPFPTTFTTFTLAIHSLLTNTYYYRSEGVFVNNPP